MLTNSFFSSSSKVSKAGERFLVTGWEHLSTDDVFIAAELANTGAREEETKFINCMKKLLSL